MNGKQVAEGRIEKTQPIIFSADETADVGIDLGTPVVEAIGAERKSRFTGRIPKVDRRSPGVIAVNISRSTCCSCALLALPGVACRGGTESAPRRPSRHRRPSRWNWRRARRLIDPRADELVRQMSDRLVRAQAFALEAEEVFDEVPEHSPRQQLTSTRHVALRRPNRLVGDASGDAVNRTFFYDGQVFSAIDRVQHVWASGTVPPTIDEALDTIAEQTGTVIPLADFLYTNPYERLMGDVQRGVYLGIHQAAGVPCHHLSFEQATIDWQIWIDAGPDPLPRKLVITYKTEDEVPQYTVTIRKWNLNATLPDVLFRFTPPEGATRVDIPAFGPPPGAAPTTPQETQP